jgi:hypothetical protein
MTDHRQHTDVALVALAVVSIAGIVWIARAA